MKKDYKNATWVVDLFNRCVLKGNEYLEAKELDDDQNMHLALMDFGKDLGSVSEITVRYLLYRYNIVSDEELNGIDNFYTLWRMLCDSSLQTQLMQLGFSCNHERKSKIERFDVRERMTNLPKHHGTLANPGDWLDFVDVYDELRRLIGNFVVSERTAPLEILHPKTGDSEQEEWNYLFDAARAFHKESGYKYILITDRPQCKNRLDLFKIPWSVILDFDVETDQPDGLYYEFQHTQTDMLVERYSMTDRVKSSLSVLHWVNIAIKDDNGERYADRPLALKTSKKLRIFLESYHRKHAEPVVVVVSMNDESYSKTLKSAANVIYEIYENESAPNESDVKFLLLQNSSVGLILEDNRLLQTFNLGVRQLISGVRKEIVDKPTFNGRYMVPANLKDGSSSVEMDKEQYLRLRQYVDLVFLGVEQEESEDARFIPEDFYRGYSYVTWKMIAQGGIAVIPEYFESWKKNLEEYCSKSGTPRLRLNYRRGMGGTTCLRMLAFSMHEKYPTIIVHTYAQGSTADEIAKLYALCNKPLLIFVDTNQLYYEEVRKLRDELKIRTFSFIMVWLIGYANHPPRGELQPLNSFAENDRVSMLEKLRHYARSPQEIARLDTQSLENFVLENRDDLSPFLLSMYVFEEDFPGIDKYVENTLKFPSLGGAERNQIPILEDILFAIALSGWAGFPVDEQSFVGWEKPLLIQRLKQGDSPLSPLIFYKKNNNRGFFKIRHYQFSVCILRYFSSSKGKRIQFTGLTDRIVQFIKDTRGDMSRLENEETIRLLRRLFINRDWDSSNTTAGSEFNRRVYSEVICKMIEDHKAERRLNNTKDAYDPETDGILRIFRALTKYYPDEMHFRAHLARYYFYTARNYESGLREIDKALAIVEDNPERNPTDVALAYHIKGMGYRARIYNNYIREIRKLLDRLSKNDISRADAEVQIKLNLEEMRQDAQRADENFKRSEEYGGDNAVFALISICQLHIEIQKLYVDVIKKSAQYDLAKLVEDEDSVKNVDLLQNENDELQACFDFFDEEIELSGQGNGASKSKKNKTLVQDINTDVIALTQLDEDVIRYCQQCLSNHMIPEKAHYRHLIAQIQFNKIRDRITTEESQQKLQEIIDLYENNIMEKPYSGTDIRNWFNAVRRLSCDHNMALEILESCREKLDRWIDGGNASRDAYLYRYIVRFLMDYENGSLNSSESRRSLQQMQEDVKIQAETLPTKTTVVFWIGYEGYGLNRLISNADFYNPPLSQNIEVLQPMEGKLPERSKFTENTAYIDFCGHNVFFRPIAVRGTVTAANSGAFITCGIGFSYDGLRSYHDSIKLITKQLIKREHSPGERVTVRVYKHNATWVECLIDGEDQPVIIGKDALPAAFDPKIGKWPEKGESLKVVLIERRNYELRGDIFTEREITKDPFIAECIT